MTYIILKQPHPLDSIWSVAMIAVDDAQEAIDALPDGYTNEQIDALVDRHMAAVLAVIALPGRNVADCIYKLDLTGPLDSGALAGCDRAAIVTEALSLVDASVSRGAKLMRAMPDLLEEVAI